MATIIAAIITAIGGILASGVGIGGSFGLQAWLNSEQKKFEGKASEKGVSFAQLQNFLDTLIAKAKPLGSNTVNKIIDKINSTVSNYSTTGEASKVMSRIRSRLRETQQQINNHLSIAQQYEQAAANQNAAMANLSAEVRSEGKDEKGNWTDNPAGTIGKNAEQLAKQAAEHYEKANALGETIL